ncbi:MAG: NAD(+) synthase [Candidatus Nanoarchaeia archaeon]
MNKTIKLPEINPERVSKEIGDFVIQKITDLKYAGCVIGLSGGIDSTTTAAVIKKAFDNYNKNNVDRLELVGYILPTKINSEEDTKDGVRVANDLGIRYEVLSLDKIVDSYQTTNPEAFATKYNQGNMISRIRANVLSTKSATENKILTGTGNRDEDFGVGYYTLFGDGAVHISPIGNLSKRLVKELATYLGVSKDLVYREPTAGLEIGQTDFKDLGYGYDVVELVTAGVNQGFSREELISSHQINPLVKSQIRKLENPKLYNVEMVVDDILKRNKIAEYKAEIIHPPAAIVTLDYK